MTQTMEKGSYQVTVGDPVEFSGISAQEVLALCAAGARNGSDDAVDVALVTQAERSGGVPYELGSWSGPSAARKYAVAQLRHTPDGRDLRVARGDLDAVLALANESDETRKKAHESIHSLQEKGYVGVGVGVAPEQGAAWKFAGIVPVRVTRQHLPVRNAPADFRYVHVWDWQLRILHWLWVFLICTLAVTGYMIGHAWVLKTRDLNYGFAFGWIRFAHYAGGWLFAAVIVMRITRLFWGSNKYQRWPSLIPHRLQEVKDTFITAKNYLFMQSGKNPPYVGHNPLQQFTYTGILLVMIGMLVTGFAIYAMYEPRNWFYAIFMPLNYVLGNANVRLIHTIGMWVLLIFIPAHIYLSVLAGNVDREGTISSIVSGGRWLRRGVKFHDE